MAIGYELPHMGGVTFSTKLAAKLLDEMRTGEFSEAEKLPSEVELSQYFGVSRSVIRDVLSILEREGFIARGRGVGTIIQRKILELPSRLDLRYEYNELIRSRGGKPSTDSVKVYETLADEELAESMQVAVGEPLIVCEKRILSDDMPVVFSIGHLPKAIFKDMDYHRLDWSLPVFDILESQFGIVADADIAKISATNGSPEVRKAMELNDSDALLFIDEVGYYKLSRPVFHTWGYYTNYFDFTLLRRMF